MSSNGLGATKWMVPVPSNIAPIRTARARPAALSVVGVMRALCPCGPAMREPSRDGRAWCPQRGTLMAFELRNVPLLSRVGADRADQLRSDVDAALAGWPDAAVLRVGFRKPGVVLPGAGGGSGG